MSYIPLNINSIPLITGQQLSGLTTVTSTIISSNDSILSAFGKIQGQINFLNSTSGVTLYVNNAISNATSGIYSYINTEIKNSFYNTIVEENSNFTVTGANNGNKFRVTTGTNGIVVIFDSTTQINSGIPFRVLIQKADNASGTITFTFPSNAPSTIPLLASIGNEIEISYDFNIPIYVVKTFVGGIDSASNYTLSTGNNGSINLNPSGTGQVKVNSTLKLSASTTTTPSLNIALGTTPTSNQNSGDIYFNGTRLNVYNNGTNSQIAYLTDFSQLLSVNNPAYTGTLSTGTLTYSDTGILETLQSSINSYNQLIIQNSNSGTQGSADIIVNNNLSTATSHYGDFGINSSTFTGTSNLSLPNAVYLSATTADLVLGTTTNNAIHFVINSSATDSMTINTSGIVANNAISISNTTTSTSTTTGALIVSGGVGIAGATYLGGTITAPSLILNSNLTTTIPLTIRGSYTQTADLTEWNSYNGSNSTVIARVDSNGNINVPSISSNVIPVTGTNVIGTNLYIKASPGTGNGTINTNIPPSVIISTPQITSSGTIQQTVSNSFQFGWMYSNSLNIPSIWMFGTSYTPSNTNYNISVDSNNNLYLQGVSATYLYVGSNICWVANTNSQVGNTTSQTYYLISGGTSYNAQILIDTTTTGANNYTAGNTSLSWDNTNGLGLNAANGSSRINRWLLNLQNSINTVASESSDLQLIAKNSTTDTFIINSQIRNPNYSGSTVRMLTADQNGNFQAIHDLQIGQITNVTLQGYLTTQNNWTTTGVYSGTNALTNTYQGQWYSDSEFFYFNISDNSPIRIPQSFTIDCKPYQNISGSVTLDNTYIWIFATGTITITLPSASTYAGKEYYITNAGTGTITISGTVSGATNPTISVQYGNYYVKSNGTNWFKI